MILNNLLLLSGKAFINIQFDIDKILDGDGIMISIIGYVIVFLSLVLLAFFISTMSHILIRKQSKRVVDSGKDEMNRDELSMTGEINAAISLALHMHFNEIHDFESTVLTIKKAPRPYSPWSSKIYGITINPREFHISKTSGRNRFRMRNPETK
jgi:glutaconyl-CoA/methylmalonyl-CoA decarboxylase subunit delta